MPTWKLGRRTVILVLATTVKILHFLLSLLVIYVVITTALVVKTLTLFVSGSISCTGELCLPETMKIKPLLISQGAQ